jgi:hypothetical protein
MMKTTSNVLTNPEKEIPQIWKPMGKKIENSMGRDEIFSIYFFYPYLRRRKRVVRIGITKIYTKTGSQNICFECSKLISKHMF